MDNYELDTKFEFLILFWSIEKILFMKFKDLYLGKTLSNL